MITNPVAAHGLCHAVVELIAGVLHAKGWAPWARLVGLLALVVGGMALGSMP